jgi:cytochrome c oxidase cbb3-type subunit 3
VRYALFPPVRPLVFPLFAATVSFSVACERAPSADALSQWTPADHDRAEEQQAAARPQPQDMAGRPPQAGSQAANTAPTRPPPRANDGGAAASAAGAASNLPQLVEITWEQACAPCHGPSGHGDGPNGPMVNAPDITRDDVVGKMSDDDIANQIKNGKNRMPKFDLPEPVVRGLVARIRANRGR